MLTIEHYFQKCLLVPLKSPLKYVASSTLRTHLKSLEGPIQLPHPFTGQGQGRILMLESGAKVAAILPISLSKRKLKKEKKRGGGSREKD